MPAFLRAVDMTVDVLYPNILHAVADTGSAKQCIYKICPLSYSRSGLGVRVARFYQGTVKWTLCDCDFNPWND